MNTEPTGVEPEQLERWLDQTADCIIPHRELLKLFQYAEAVQRQEETESTRAFHGNLDLALNSYCHRYRNGNGLKEQPIDEQTATALHDEARSGTTLTDDDLRLLARAGTTKDPDELVRQAFYSVFTVEGPDKDSFIGPITGTEPGGCKSHLVVKGVKGMNESGRARQLLEASVRLPPRGRRWIAAYTGVVPGQQVWRSTGETNREAAMAKALAWETEAKRRRAALGVIARPPGIRVRRGEVESPDRAVPPVGPLSQREVAMILRISERAVRNVEHRALAKLRRHPDLRKLWGEIAGRTDAEQPGVLESRETKLTPSEVAALFGLAKTAEEAQALTKLLAWIEGDTE